MFQESYAQWFKMTLGWIVPHFAHVYITLRNNMRKSWTKLFPLAIRTIVFLPNSATTTDGHLFNLCNWSTFLSQRYTHADVFVVKVDDEAEGAPAHGLGWDEWVLKRSLALWRHHRAQLQSSEVLDVKLKVLRVAEGSVQRFNHEIFFAFIGEAQQEFHNVVGWKV